MSRLAITQYHWIEGMMNIPILDGGRIRKLCILVLAGALLLTCPRCSSKKEDPKKTEVLEVSKQDTSFDAKLKRRAAMLEKVKEQFKDMSSEDMAAIARGIAALGEEDLNQDTIPVATPLYSKAALDSVLRLRKKASQDSLK